LSILYVYVRKAKEIDDAIVLWRRARVFFVFVLFCLVVCCLLDDVRASDDVPYPRKQSVRLIVCTATDRVKKI
jgi:hypothetical protein